MDLSNISILGLMPPNLAADKNIKMMAEAFDEALREIIERIPGVGMIPNLTLNKIVDETLIDLLAWQFHVDFYEPGLPIEVKRELVLKSLDWHYRKGTPSVVEEIVSTVFTKAVIQEWYEYGGLPYRFRIATDEQMPDAEGLNKVLRAVKSVKNTRSFLDSITQLVYFLDKVITDELHRMTLRMKFTDDFSRAGKIFHNGRILRDGKTILGTELRYIIFLRDGARIRDGSMIRGKMYKRFPAADAVLLPLSHGGGSGMRERFSLSFGSKYEERHFARAFHNGSNYRNRSIKRNGLSGKSMGETLRIWCRKHHFHNGVYFRNGNIKHDGMILIPLE
jgi:phage tail P2-like protein